MSSANAKIISNSTDNLNAILNSELNSGGVVGDVSIKNDPELVGIVQMVSNQDSSKITYTTAGDIDTVSAGAGVCSDANALNALRQGLTKQHNTAAVLLADLDGCDSNKPFAISRNIQVRSSPEYASVKSQLDAKTTEFSTYKQAHPETQDPPANEGFNVNWKHALGGAVGLGVLGYMGGRSSRSAQADAQSSPRIIYSSQAPTVITDIHQSLGHVGTSGVPSEQLNLIELESYKVTASSVVTPPHPIVTAEQDAVTTAARQAPPPAPQSRTVAEGLRNSVQPIASPSAKNTATSFFTPKVNATTGASANLSAAATSSVVDNQATIAPQLRTAASGAGRAPVAALQQVAQVVESHPGFPLNVPSNLSDSIARLKHILKFPGESNHAELVMLLQNLLSNKDDLSRVLADADGRKEIRELLHQVKSQDVFFGEMNTIIYKFLSHFSILAGVTAEGPEEYNRILKQVVDEAHGISERMGALGHSLVTAQADRLQASIGVVDTVIAEHQNTLTGLAQTIEAARAQQVETQTRILAQKTEQVVSRARLAALQPWLKHFSGSNKGPAAAALLIGAGLAGLVTAWSYFKTPEEAALAVAAA